MKEGQGGSDSEKDISDHRRIQFESDYKPYSVGDLACRDAKGTLVEATAYEIVVDPSDQVERHRTLAVFALRAVEAGYKQAVGPLVLQNVGYRDDKGTQPLAAVLFVFSRPIEASRASG